MLICRVVVLPGSPGLGCQAPRYGREVERGMFPIRGVTAPGLSDRLYSVDPASVCTGTLLGTITVGPAPVRGGDLNLDTGNGDSIPRMNAGNIVSVCTAAGRRVLSGALRRDR